MTNVLRRKANHIVVVHLKMFFVYLYYIYKCDFQQFSLFSYFCTENLEKRVSMNFLKTSHVVTLLYLVLGEWSESLLM